MVLKQVAMVISIVMATTNSVYSPELDTYDDSGEWILEEVAGFGEPLPWWGPHEVHRTSIAIDSNGLPHIAFRNVETEEINYSHKDSTGSWHTETIASSGTGVALALDLMDRPVICYRNESVPIPFLSCAFSEGPGWRHVTVDPFPLSGLQISLTIDDHNRSHMAYHCGGETRYAWWNGTSWNITVLRGPTLPGTADLSLDLDRENNPHIVLLTFFYVEHGLWLYRLNGTKWEKEAIDPTHTRNIFSLQLNETDTPFVGTVNPDRKMPIVMYKDDGLWRTRYVDIGAEAGFGSFVLDSNDEPHMAYTHRIPLDDDLRYAHTEDGTWKNETVDSEGRVGYLPSIATDHNNVPHISYIDLTDRKIMYATKKKRIEADINIDPNTLSLRSRGKWITCYIELPGLYDPRDINASTLLLMDALSPELNPKYGFVKSEDSYIVDLDGDGIYERMVKFERSKVMEMLEPGETVILTVTGRLFDGTDFQGSDVIRVIDRPIAQANNINNLFHPQQQTQSQETPGCHFPVRPLRQS